MSTVAIDAGKKVKHFGIVTTAPAKGETPLRAGFHFTGQVAGKAGF